MQKSVLVVEDEAGVRRALGRLLGQRGFRMIEAANGREAIDRLAEATPSAIVIDLLMPVMSGAELLKALRRNGFYRRIPTVVMTGNSDASKAGDILGIPVVLKPNLEQLPDILERLIAASHPSAPLVSGDEVAGGAASAASAVKKTGEHLLQGGSR